MKSRILFVPTLVLFITALGCGGTSSTKKTQAPVEQKKPMVEKKEEAIKTIAEAKPKAPAFCAEDGRIIERHHWRYCKVDGVVDGGFEYKEDGTVLLAGRVSSGEMVGEWTAYWKNGRRKWTTKYEQSKESGLVSLWYEDGTQRGAIQYVEGKRHGVIKLFHPNGKLSMSGAYKQGKPTGSWTYFHNNGEKAHLVAYNDKGRQGIHKHWSPDGKPTGDKVGRLDRQAIREKMHWLQKEIVDCYTHNRIFDKSSGKVVVRFTIGYSGDVSEAKAYNKGFSNSFIDSCTLRSIELMRFPKNPYGLLPVFDSFNLSVE